MAGCACSNRRNSVPNMKSSQAGEVVVTVALRRVPPRIAISPKKSPGTKVATVASSAVTTAVPSMST